MNYVVAGMHSWNRRIFDTQLRRLHGTWTYVSTPEELEQVYEIQPRYIFFLHWSWLVPEDITDNFECVCFHPSHLPYGRGGTPIQNLILEGWEETQLTAFRMTDEIDAGPIYAQSPLSLKGPLHQIFAREMVAAASMVSFIIKNEPAPVPQEGQPTYFRRRRPEDSELPEYFSFYDVENDELHEYGSVDKLYDQIRMVDSEDYPRAFIEYGDYNIEFCDAELKDDKVIAKAIIRKR